MKIKLDENLGHSVVQVFRRAGHDVETVRQENLSGASDRRILEICQAEERCLVTLDLDFSNPLIFDPALYPGIAVLRVLTNPYLPRFRLFGKPDPWLISRQHSWETMDRPTEPDSCLPAGIENE